MDLHKWYVKSVSVELNSMYISPRGPWFTIMPGASGSEKFSDHNTSGGSSRLFYNHSFFRVDPVTIKCI